MELANDGIYVQFQFVDNQKKRHMFTMFHQALATILPDWETSTENKIRKNLMELDKLIIITNNRGVVDEIRFAK